MSDKTLAEIVREAWKLHKVDAKKAFDLFDSWCIDGMRRGASTGMGTTERLAVRIYNGKSIEEAAAAEYVYRWHLAIKAPDQCGATGSHDWRSSNPRACLSIFGTPHLIGL